MSRDSSRGRNAVKPPADNNNLTVPSTSRSRRPASRASSPAPITAAAQSSLARRAGTRSGSVAPADEESSSAGASTGRRISPSRGTSPPDDSKKNNHHGLASTAPFQSSPLAASAITMEPLLDTDEVADQADSKLKVPEVEISPSAAAKNASAKRKASALSQEVSLNDEEAESAAVSDSLDEVSKRLKRDTADDAAAAVAAAADAVERTVKEGSPSSVSSSRRTSPRMSSDTLHLPRDPQGQRDRLSFRHVFPSFVASSIFLSIPLLHPSLLVFPSSLVLSSSFSSYPLLALFSFPALLYHRIRCCIAFLLLFRQVQAYILHSSSACRSDSS